jgi:hypothetical protein
MSASQQNFLRDGGPMSAVLEAKYQSGELSRDYVYRDYPKLLRRSLGIKHFDHATEVIRGNATVIRDWSEDREVFEEIIVKSEAEEEAVLSGGRTAAQVEEDRQAMIVLCRQRNIQVDPTWGIVRLQRELGAAPSNETIDAMRTKIADLEEKAALRERIATLEAMIAGRAQPPPVAAHTESTDDANELTFRRSQPASTTTPRAATQEDEAEDLRQQLTALGVAVDRRWGLPRLRQELDDATAPQRR